MKQLVSPNLNQTGTIGYCLQFAREAFGCPAVEPTAWAAWNATQFKHTDAIPTDVSVPIWFSYTEGGTNYGHVAINVPGRGVLSSPWKQGTDHAWLSSIDQLISIYSDNQKNPMAYVGWSEDISKVRVVTGDNMPTTEEILQSALNAARQADLVHQSALNAETAKNAQLQATIDSLNAKATQDVQTITSLVSQLNAAKKEIADLQDQVAHTTVPTTLPTPVQAPVETPTPTPVPTLLDRILKWLRLK